MGYAKHVGRVGALAVALGIGAAVATTPGVAWATDGEGDNPGVEAPSDPGGGSVADPGTATVAGKQDPGVLIRKRLEHAADDLRDGIRKAVTGVVRSSGGAITSTRRSGSDPGNGNVRPAPIEDDRAPLDKPQPPKDEPKPTAFVANSSANEVPSFSAPRWRAPQAQLRVRPALKPVPKAIDDVNDVLKQSINQVTVTRSTTGTNPAAQQAFSTLDATDVEEQPQVRNGFVAPIAIMTGVLNAAITPFLDPTPGQPAPQNPVLWAVLGWVRRQIQDSPFGKVVLNRSPEITTPLVVENSDGTFTITPSPDDYDPDGDALTYTAVDGQYGTVTPNGTGGFTYTPGDDFGGTDTITLTASDAGAYPHIHGLAGLFGQGGAHTDSVTVNIVAEPTDDGPVVEQPPTPNDDGTYEMQVRYGAPGQYTDVMVPEAGQPGAPRYWRVTSQSYDPDTGVLTLTMEPTLAAQLRAGQHMPVDDSFTVQATNANARQSFTTFALSRSAIQPLAAADESGNSVDIAPPPGATLSVTEDALSVGPNPAGVVMTDKYAYVMNANNPGKVTVVDANPDDDDPGAPTYNTVVKTIDVGGAAAFGTVAGDNLYVSTLPAGSSPGAVTVISTSSNTVIDTIPVSGAPFALQASPDGTRVYVSDNATGKILVIDADPSHTGTYNTVVGSIPVSGAVQSTPAGYEGYTAPQGLAFSEDGTRLYASRIHYRSATDLDENDQPIPGTTVTHYDGDIVVIDTDPSSATYNSVIDLDPETPEIETIHTDLSGYSMASNRDRVYVTAYDYNQLVAVAQGQSTDNPNATVLVLDTDPSSPTYNMLVDVDPTTPETDGIAVGTLPYNAAVSPDGSVLYVVNVLDGTVSVIDTLTNEQIGSPFVYDSTPQNLEASHQIYINVLAISPDGKRMYISKYQDGTVTTISIDPVDPSVQV
ncbi:hypothetical protein DVS77_24255 [Mycolicibacterium moriokaense]|nr:hypothetical protein DVS77_24255 [Mycolicibacterium moriokaense]